MAFVNEKTKLRPQPPRLKNVRYQRPRQRNRNHDAKGHFTAKNDAPKGRKVKSIIKRYLGTEVTSEQAQALTADTLALFKALRRSLPNESPQVQDTLARRARWGVLSAWYAMKAIELGLGTKAGDAALEMSLKLDARAERLDVTALDLAARLPDAEPQEALTPWLLPSTPAPKTKAAPDSAPAMASSTDPSPKE